MDKRKVPRYRRRIPLLFWSADDKNPRKGFTQNVSVMGMFVSTNAPFKPGVRVFLEIPSGQDKLVFQAEVRAELKRRARTQNLEPGTSSVFGHDAKQAWSAISAHAPFDLVWADAPYREVVARLDEFFDRLPHLTRVGSKLVVEAPVSLPVPVRRRPT